MDSKTYGTPLEEIDNADSGGQSSSLSIAERIAEIGERLLHPFEAILETAPCEHDWAPVRMVKFADASSEVMRCMKCGSVDIVERKSA